MRDNSTETTVYFIRHAEPDFTNHNDLERPLTAKGKEDTKLVTAFLANKNIDVVLSSPFRRAVETVQDFADSKGFTIHLVEDFRERKVGTEWIEEFHQFAQHQWEDFSYHLEGGESLAEVQGRCISALTQVLHEFQGKNIAVGNHGTALCTILNYFDPSFGYEDFKEMRDKMPWAVQMVFHGKECTQITKIDLL